MKLEILNTSVTIVAEQHNPTILHPSFLQSQEIVPCDWKVDPSPGAVISSPVFATAKFANGFIFTVEEKKLQVIDSQVISDEKSPVAELAFKYVKTLPYVQYQAIGINFNGFIESPDADRIIIEKFIKTGSCDYKSNHLDSLGLRLIYKLSDARLRLACDSGKVAKQENEKEQQGILLSANYHADINGDNRIGKIRESTLLFAQRWKHFFDMTKTIFGLEN